MQHNQSAAAAIHIGLNDVHDPELLARVQRRDRFVRNQEGRFGSKGAGAVYARHFAARECVGMPVGQIRQVAQFEGGIHGLRVFGVQASGRCAIGEPAQRHDIAHTVRPGKRPLLRQIGDAACTLHRGKRFTVRAPQADRAGGTFLQAEGRADQAGLAGSVRPQQSDQLARLKRKACPLQQCCAVFGEAQILCDDLSH